MCPHEARGVRWEADPSWEPPAEAKCELEEAMASVRVELAGSVEPAVVRRKSGAAVEPVLVLERWRPAYLLAASGFPVARRCDVRRGRFAGRDRARDDVCDPEPPGCF